MINANLIPQPHMLKNVVSSELCFDLTEKVQNAYFQYLKNLCSFRATSAQEIAFVNTSLHGVSDNILKQAFACIGLPSYIPVALQQLPDPDFPTVNFPNPEEKGALDLAIETANKMGATYIIAQDPDADRFAAAEKSISGEWIVFTGDQLGSLFASKILEAYKQSGKPINKLAMIASTVSSKMIRNMADHEGFKFMECLTG